MKAVHRIDEHFAMVEALGELRLLRARWKARHYIRALAAEGALS